MPPAPPVLSVPTPYIPMDPDINKVITFTVSRCFVRIGLIIPFGVFFGVLAWKIVAILTPRLLVSMSSTALLVTFLAGHKMLPKVLYASGTKLILEKPVSNQDTSPKFRIDDAGFWFIQQVLFVHVFTHTSGMRQANLPIGIPNSITKVLNSSPSSRAKLKIIIIVALLLLGPVPIAYSATKAISGQPHSKNTSFLFTDPRSTRGRRYTRRLSG